MKRFLCAFLLGLLLAGCATRTGTTTPADTLKQTKQAYSVAQSAVVLYVSLPLCGSAGASKVCSDPKLVIELADANKAATKAIAAADAAIKAGAPDALVLLNAASAATASLATRTPAVKP